MTPRPSLAAKPRPLSAIYIGPNPPAHYIPDLPEPPSPGGSSTGSGLPSPPATNSTGSGSTGDNSTNAGSIRQRNANMSNGTNVNTPTPLTKSQITSRVDEDEDENENDNDDDNTAKLNRQQSHRSSTENVIALQRVRSLTQRNRMALDKLSAFSRLGTPSPTRNSRSPAPPPPAASSSSASSSSKSTSSRLSSHSHARSQSQSQPVQPRRQESREAAQSGSETERESQHALQSTSVSYSSSSEDLLALIPSSTRPQSSLGIHRQRRISAPASPAKALSRTNSASSRTPRTRLLTLGSNDDRDVTSAALAAVASSRRSPTGGSGKKRGALPPEFTDNRGSVDGASPGDPSTPYNKRPSPTTHVTFSNTSPRGPRFNRPSVRELVRRHQARLHSEDFNSPNGERGAEDYQTPERLENQRTGNSTPGLGRSLVGEGLKAAGIGKKDEDVFGSEEGGEQRTNSTFSSGGSNRSRSRRGGSVDWAAEVRAGQMQERELEQERSRSRASLQLNTRVGEPSSARRQTDPRTPDTTTSNSSKALAARGTYSGSRPPTSMANSRQGEAGGSAPSTSRPYSSAYTLPERERDRAGAGSTSGRHPTSHDRNVSSPFGSRRFSPMPSASPSLQQHQNAASDHSRLMLESLSVFESHLTRLPPMGNTTTTIPDLFRSAQGIVHASDKLNAQLRAGTNRALEEQIDAEIGDGDERSVDLVDVWRKVGGEYRESMRVSDELVRSMTGFLLGVGKLLKEAVALSGDGGNHVRSMSLDDEVVRRSSPDKGGRRSVEERMSNGRASVEGRRSTDERSESRRSRDLHLPFRGDTTRRFANRGDGILNTSHRPPSALNIRDIGALSPAVTGNSSANLTSSVRRLFTPREQREQQLSANALNVDTPPGMTSSESQETLQGYEPSPTPASRRAQNRMSLPDRRTLPALAIPSPLPTLPSESIIRRHQNNLKKGSTTSVATVRPSAVPMSPFPSLTTPNPTTAITPHTVSNSPTVPLHRSVSGSSSRSNVTFSKPLAVSVSTLSGLQQQHNQMANRTLSMSSDTGPVKNNGVAVPSTPLSGSETERDTRRRTIGVKPVKTSLDGGAGTQGDRRGESSSGSNQARAPPSNAARRERRRTLSEIFSQ